MEATPEISKLLPEEAAAAAALERSVSSDAWSQKAFADAIMDGNALYLAARLDGKLAGCCGLWQSFETADICNVAVDASFWRKGIAKAMLCALMEEGRARGVSDFTLEVRKNNLPAIGLYEKLGFVTEGVRKNFYANPKDDALIMWKRQEAHG